MGKGTGIQHLLCQLLSRGLVSKSFAAAAPVNDLRLYNNLRSMLSATMGAALSKVMGHHLLNFNEVLVAMALFHSAVCPEIKREIVKSMIEKPGSDIPSQNPNG